MSELKNQERFIDELINSFPEIKSEILDEDYLGLVSLQIGCFRRYTQQAIDRSDVEMVKKCIEFVQANLKDVEFSIENSLVISYLGKLRIAKNSKIECLLSSDMKDIREKLNAYYQSMSTDHKLNSFLDDLKRENLL